MKIHEDFTRWVESDSRLSAEHKEILDECLPTAMDTRELKALVLVLFVCYSREKALEDAKAPTGVLYCRYLHTMWRDLGTMERDMRGRQPADKLRFKRLQECTPGEFRTWNAAWCYYLVPGSMCWDIWVCRGYSGNCVSNARTGLAYVRTFRALVP